MTIPDELVARAEAMAERHRADRRARAVRPAQIAAETEAREAQARTQSQEDSAPHPADTIDPMQEEEF